MLYCNTAVLCKIEKSSQCQDCTVQDDETSLFKLFIVCSCYAGTSLSLVRGELGTRIHFNPSSLNYVCVFPVVSVDVVRTVYLVFLVS